MKIVIEASPIAQNQKTGVGYFAEQLATAMEESSSLDTTISYLWLNFLGRSSPSSTLLESARQEGRLIAYHWLPQRVYAKLVKFSIAPPIVSRADWTLFPNFYIWPLIGSKKRGVVVHDMCFLRHPEYVEEKNRAFLQKVALKSIKRADLIITISSFTKQEIIDLTHTPEKKILVIDIPVDRSRFLPEHNRGPARLEERYGITKKYILTLGTVEPRKNIQLLIASYCLLPKEVRDTYSLVIAGKQGWKTSSLYLLIKQRRSQGFDIITTDYIDNEDTSTLYRNASAYAITTFYEGFGMPLLEALHCGVPTVATDIPVLREVAGEYSCLWSDFDPVHFRDQLLNILTDPELSRRLSENAAAQADRFSWDRTAKIVLTRLSQHNRE